MIASSSSSSSSSFSSFSSSSFSSFSSSSSFSYEVEIVIESTGGGWKDWTNYKTHSSPSFACPLSVSLSPF